MDNIKTLFDKKQYELIVKLALSSTKAGDHFYALSSLVCLEKYEEALRYIKEKEKYLDEYLPMVMQLHIEILCSLKRFDDAYKQVDYYEQKPYHSQQAEEVLASLKNTIRKYEKAFYKADHELSKDEIINMLKANDTMTVVNGLDALRELDISPYLMLIKKILIEHKEQTVRSFALLLLVQKELNQEFSFNHLGKVITVNPSKLKPPFIGEEFSNFASRLETSFKDVTLVETAMQILSSYLIYIYPEEVDYDDPLLIEALHIVASEFIKQPYQSAKLEETKDLVEDIKSALNDF